MLIAIGDNISMILIAKMTFFAVMAHNLSWLTASFVLSDLLLRDVWSYNCRH